MPAKQADLREFVDFGYLQEANRQFFHPLGLALAVMEHDDGSITLHAILDARDDPEGYVFDDGVLDREKTLRVWNEWDRFAEARVMLLGDVVQPPPPA